MAMKTLLLDDFTRAYFECALWSSMDESDAPLDKNFTLDDFDSGTRHDMIVDCEAFQLENRDSIGINPSDFRRAGHDFWLTRNRHGAGFWDGDWPEPAATVLTNAAHKCGEYDLYVGSDAKIYGN